MLSTFFGAHSFGGDAAYIDRLARALLRRGHEVEVVHCADAFELLRHGRPLRAYTPPAGLKLHTLSSGRLGGLSPLWTHQTGGPGSKRQALLRFIRDGGFDVVHFHNISLLGGPKGLGLPASGAVKLLTAHDHWLVCPLSLLWKFDERECERAQCAQCALRAGRPPQWWRHSRLMQRSMRHIDRLIFPSEHALETHRSRGGAEARHVVLPYFLPDDWTAGNPAPADVEPGRPYFAAAGRLVKEKGFQDAIHAMPQLPEADLVIAGAGPYEAELRRHAGGMSNVRFTGLLDYAALARLFGGARAVIVPSLFPETFGYVTLEAFSVGAPVIARRRGALTGVIERSAGGTLFETRDDLIGAMRRLNNDDALRAEWGANGRRALRTFWDEQSHIDAYLALIEQCRTESQKRA